MKSMLRGKFIAHSALIKNLERPYMSNLTIHMNALNQREANKMRLKENKTNLNRPKSLRAQGLEHGHQDVLKVGGLGLV